MRYDTEEYRPIWIRTAWLLKDWEEAIKINDMIDTHEALERKKGFPRSTMAQDAGAPFDYPEIDQSPAYRAWMASDSDLSISEHAEMLARRSTPPQARLFDTGATRDVEDHKHDFESFLSPLVIREFAAYMHEHRFQSDGKMRDGDNWQKGMPLESLMKSMFRHFMDVWTLHRSSYVRPLMDFAGEEVRMEDALCGVLFNVQAYLHELLK